MRQWVGGRACTRVAGRRRMAADEGGQPRGDPPRIAQLLGQLASIDERAYAVPRMVCSMLLFERAGWLTGNATRSAFSGAANTRGALEDRIHNWIGYCDQAGESATATMACPAFWQPITDALPDKLALFTILSGLALYTLAAFRQREPRVFCKLITEHFVLNSTLLTLRAAVVASTIMPAPSPLCRNSTHWELGPGGRPTRGWFLGTVDCNDAVRMCSFFFALLGVVLNRSRLAQMFSGHTCLYSLVCVMWVQSFMPRPAKAAWVCFFVLCCIASVATRDHYSECSFLSSGLKYEVLHFVLRAAYSFRCACGDVRLHPDLYAPGGTNPQANVR